MRVSLARSTVERVGRRPRYQELVGLFGGLPVGQKPVEEEAVDGRSPRDRPWSHRCYRVPRWCRSRALPTGATGPPATDCPEHYMCGPSVTGQHSAHDVSLPGLYLLRSLLE